ncbi:MAG TPA: response regulator [Candidatus Sulfotelmatobacter sp.]|nr:response regulator [Candidatus Sulfotelmatobacter sp.]HWI56709.1 response regulator [Bacillota bacterium]
MNTGGSPAILVAEDDPDDLFLLMRALVKSGITIPAHFVHDGREVIDYLLGEPPYQDRTAYPLPSLLLLDLMMPRLNGFEVLTWLQLQPGLRRLPVVVLSGSDRQPDIDRAHALGASVYVVKPQDPAQLINIVTRLKEKYALYPRGTPRLECLSA